MRVSEQIIRRSECAGVVTMSRFQLFDQFGRELLQINNLPMHQPVYPLDFEAQYQEIQEKLIAIVAQHRDQIKNVQQISPEALLDEIDQINQKLQDHELLFIKQNIYAQFATPQQMNEKKKEPPQMCPNCGDEIKKQVQCQFCAEISCLKCCSRKRVIPFLSKDPRLCCEVCHKKYIKLFYNKDFFEESEKLLSVINFVKVRTEKITQKKAQKLKIVEENKNKKRNEKMKQNAIEKKIKEEEKKLKAAQEQFQNIIRERAERIQEEERKKMKQEEEVRMQQELTEKRQRQEEEIKKAQALEIEKADKLSDPTPDDEQKQQKSDHTHKISPNQSIDHRDQREENKTTTETKKSESRSRKASDQEAMKLPDHLISGKSISSENNNDEEHQSERKSRSHEAGGGALDKAFMNILMSKKEKEGREDDDRKSIRSSMSKTSKSILEMSMNELLGLKIPSSPLKMPGKKDSQIKQEEGESMEADERRILQRSEETLFNLDKSIKPVPVMNRQSVDRRTYEKPIEEIVSEEDARISKEQILRNSSLITSQQQSEEERRASAPMKCSCEIM